MLNSANIFLGRGWGESLGYPFNAVVHFQKPRSERKKISVAREREKKKSVRGGIRTHAHIRGPECFELALASKEFILESGALDHSATLTAD